MTWYTRHISEKRDPGPWKDLGPYEDPGLYEDLGPYEDPVLRALLGLKIL